MKEAVFIKAVVAKCDSPLASALLAAWLVKNKHKSEFTDADVDAVVRSIQSKSDVKRCGPAALAEKDRPRGFKQVRALLKRHAKSYMLEGR